MAADEARESTRMNLPTHVADEAALEDLLAEPS
jgi:hypothetical protein